jgi:hypothetical protein
MPCLIGCFALFMPRLAIFLVWFFSDYLDTAYQTLIWPVLGFLFMPLTTLAYAWAWHQGNGSVSGIGLVVVVLAVLSDLGLLGTGESSRRSVRSRYR